jgi:acyl carrier protein
MEREQIRDVLKGILEDETGDPLDVLPDAMRVEEFGFDSVDIVSLVMRLERHFRLHISHAELAEATTVGSLIDLVHAKSVAPSAFDEDFTEKRFNGFILDGQGTIGIITWPGMYESVCRQLYLRDKDRFRALVDNPDFISYRGRHAFATNPAPLREAILIGDGLYAENNLSANGVRDNIRRLLVAFDIPVDRMRIFWCQDRDAA